MRSDSLVRASSYLFSGVDHISLDQRIFYPSPIDIQNICAFFKIGSLKRYEKERAIKVSHSNFFIFVETTKGQYAIKFYPSNAEKILATEYSLNQFLATHYFSTPLMHAGHKGKPYILINGKFATCFSYIQGNQAWQKIKNPQVIKRINTVLLSLKNHLLESKVQFRFLKQEDIKTRAKGFLKELSVIPASSQRKMIEQSLHDALYLYKDNVLLFKRQVIHNNASLTNFLIDKKTVYLLDLSHIREDYILSDLSSMLISCIFFNIPVVTMRTMTADYFSQHKMQTSHFIVLKVLLKFELIKEYLKNIRREKTLNLNSNLERNFQSYLLKRKSLIENVLRKIEFYLK